MSLPEFWLSVRTGAGLLAPKATVDSPRLNASDIEGVLRRANIWLTPACVRGFNEEDFFFLSEPERRELTVNVSRFREVASKVPNTGPATKEQTDAALPAFLTIIAALGFDRYADAEAYRLGKQIENLIQSARPLELVEIRFETGLDNTRDPAIWIWAILADATASDDVFPEITNKTRRLLESASRSVAPDRWPYVRFRIVSEQNEIMEANAR